MPFLSPNNPFVADPNYFSNLITPETEHERIVHKTILLTSRVACGLIGFPLIVLVLYLIIKQSPSHFVPYRNMLLLGVTVDSLLVMLAVFNQVRIKVVEGTILVTSHNFLITLLGDQMFCATFMITTVAPQFGCCVLPTEYYYRYKVITSKKQPSVWKLLLYFCLPFTLALPLSVNMYFMQFSSLIDPNPEAIDYSDKWYPEVPIDRLVVARIEDKQYAFQQFYGAVLQFVYYSTAIFLAFLTIRELKKGCLPVNENDKVKTMQSQIFKTLIAQTIIPFCGYVIPRFSTLLFAYFNLFHDYSGDVMILAMNWSPVLSMFSIIYFIVPYRKYCLQKISFVWSRKLSSSVAPNSIPQPICS